jgi:2-keto-4-pentenoate hydratase/2-oxohepta-3-ene-1,7-dioic acid hydratase in catechol pathway
MKLANVGGRAKLVIGDQAVDVGMASEGRFGPEPGAVYDTWEYFRVWAEDYFRAKKTPEAAYEPFSPINAGPPSPTPRQVFAVALNYLDHAKEGGFDPPDAPLVFAKYVSALTGPVTEVLLPEGKVDWECELVAVIGRVAHRVDPSEAWSCVAGLTVGQDLSERTLQRSGPAPQYGLAKSYPGFAPTGPVLVTPDELDDPDDLAIGCEVNDEIMQDSRTCHMIFPVPRLIAYLSNIITFLPGDIIFTGTPPGVGMGRQPPVFLRAGDHLSSHIEGIGELHQHFVAPEGRGRA